MAATEVVSDTDDVGSSGLLSDKVVVALDDELSTMSDDCVRMPLKIEATDGVLVMEADTLAESLDNETEDVVALSTPEDGKLINRVLDIVAPELLSLTDTALSVMDAEIAVEDCVPEATDDPEIVVMMPLSDVELCDCPDCDCTDCDVCDCTSDEPESDVAD